MSSKKRKSGSTTSITVGVSNACSECHRRKQKCDRKRPCGTCVSRGVVDKCCFDEDFPASNQHGLLVADRVPWPFQSDSISTELDEAKNADLGYSLGKGSNAFTSLTHILDGDDDLQAVASKHNQPAPSRTFNPKSQALITQLPCRLVVESLVTSYFSEVNWYYFLVEEYYFRDLLWRWFGDPRAGSANHLNLEELSRELRSFPAMLFQVLALAVQFLPREAPTFRLLSKNDLGLCHNYSDTGIELLGSLGGQGSAITVVQTHHLRSAWLKNLGRGVDAWHSIGNAIRSAQVIGLHQSKEIRQQGLEGTLSRVWYDEYQRRIWMNLFIWDSLIAMILGRPRTINADDCDVEPPVDCNIPKDPSITVPMTSKIGQGNAVPNTVSMNLVLHRLSQMFNQVKTLKADKPFPKDYSTIQVLHDQLTTMLDNVPVTLRHQNPDTSWDSRYPYLKQHRELVLIYANLYLMTLHRPHVAHYAESCRHAIQASITALASLDRCFALTKPEQYKSFPLSFYTVDASIFLSSIVAAHLLTESEVKARVDRVLRQALERLAIIEAYSPIAESGLAILRRCCGKLKDQCPQAYIFTISTPSTVLNPFSLQLRSSSQDFRLQQAIPTMHSAAYMHNYQPHGQQPPSLSSTGSLDTSGPCLFGSNSAEDTLSTMADVSLFNTPTDFDESYWMNLMNSIAPAPGPLMDPNIVWGEFS
ncbi:hypothetical protein PV11_07314 [Exophiala sideris]|uniref:Zn(2)-C6 fungal-type domain-containing protein n=1 Tax=Exophiala sideris TaxID=1016849 RepID=A0A0D1VUC3_9EURO|nr:hypothetical protein PV11_07314 [Exophiala sideris]